MYLTATRRQLFGRDYDATGFWHRADEFYGVGSLWTKMRAILAANTNSAAAFNIAGSRREAFAGSWAWATMRLRGAGSAWTRLSLSR